MPSLPVFIVKTSLQESQTSATRGKDKEGEDKLILTVGGQDKLDILKSMGPDRLHL